MSLGSSDGSKQDEVGIAADIGTYVVLGGSIRWIPLGYFPFHFPLFHSPLFLIVMA